MFLWDFFKEKNRKRKENHYSSSANCKLTTEKCNRRILYRDVTVMAILSKVFPAACRMLAKSIIEIFGHNL